MGMSSPAAFASVEDYAARYGQPADPARVAALLDDAAATLLAAYQHNNGEPWQEGASALFDAAAPGVCCSMVARALASPAGFEGASQYTQTAGPYTASVTYANPTADVYATKSDLKRLGLTGGRVWTMRPMTSADRG